MTELILLLWVLFVATLPPYLLIMQQTENTQTENTQTEPAFKLSCNNSLLTLSDGRQFQINVDRAIGELLDSLPKDIKLSDLHQHVFMIKDHITDTLPDDVSIPLYKSMNAQLNAYAGFFAELFYTEK